MFQVRDLLANAPGRISITTDGWTSKPSVDYLGITGHWVDKNWELQSVLLNFADPPAEHTGVNLKSSVIDVLHEFDITHRILGVTVDGAANMVTMMEAMKSELDEARANKDPTNEGLFIY